jgi:hypothetical protein
MLNTVRFKYFQAEVPQCQKHEFEQAISTEYSGVSEHLNENGSYFLVYWHAPGAVLRAILISDPATEMIVKAGGLPDGKEFKFAAELAGLELP